MPIIAPYRSDQAGRRVRPVSLLFMIAYSGLTGAAVALLPAEMLFMLAIPLFIAIGGILWLLPESDYLPHSLMTRLLMAYVGCNVLWPSYVSIDLPGLPWINPQRVIVFLLLVVGLVSYSTSTRLRSEIAATLSSLPLLKRAFWVFWGVTAFTILLSSRPGFSVNKWANNQIFWTFMFIVSAWLTTKGGVLNRLRILIAWTTILLGIEMIYEFSMQRVPWIDHIPSFLKVDPALLATIAGSQGRAGLELYRARGTFAVSLYTAEYLAIVYPILIHSLFVSHGMLRKFLLSIGLIAVLAAMWLTNARSAMIGFFLAIILYGAFAALRMWRRRKESLVAVSMLALVPFAALSFLVLSLTWQRLHTMTFGGGQHQGSTDARAAQWEMGIPKISANPIGHGAGTSGRVLGYSNLAGELTVDTYYLTLALDYGVLGLLSFLWIFWSQLLIGLKLFLKVDDGEDTLVGPAAIGLTSFIIIKAVSSTEANMPLAFVLLGIIFGVAYRQAAKEQPVGVVAAAHASFAKVASGRRARLALRRAAG